MNQELQALLDVAFDALQLGEDVVGKKYFSLLGDMVKVLSDLPGAASDFADLQIEIAGLQNPSNQASLVSYIESKFQASNFNSTKSQAIVAASLALVQQMIMAYQDVVALKAAIQS